MEFKELLSKLTDRVNRVGIITRAWNDAEITYVLKDIEAYIRPQETDGIVQKVARQSNAKAFANLPSVKFYNLHIPVSLLSYVYSPNSIVEYTEKNQECLFEEEKEIIGQIVLKSNDTNALARFTANIKNISKDLYIDSVIQKNDPMLMLEVASQVDGDDFIKLESAILKSKNPRAIYHLARLGRTKLDRIIDALVEIGNVEYLHKLCDYIGNNGPAIKGASRKFLINAIAEIVSEMEPYKVIRYANAYTPVYSQVIAEKFMQKCKNPRACMQFALSTGYCRVEATSKLAESGDVEYICNVLEILTRGDKEKNLYVRNISIDELLEGILEYARTEDVIANGDKIVKLLTILEPRIKRKSLINKLYAYIGDEVVGGDPESV